MVRRLQHQVAAPVAAVDAKPSRLHLDRGVRDPEILLQHCIQLADNLVVVHHASVIVHAEMAGKEYF